MSSALIKAVPTGRKSGDKLAERVTTQMINGVKITVREFDSWEGGDGESIRQQYHRCTFIEWPEVRWNHD